MLKDYIEVKVAVPTDCLPVCYVAKTTFYESWKHMYTHEDMMVYFGEEFNLEKIEQEIRDKTNTFLLASMNGKIAGYARMRRDRPRPELNTNNIIEIERMYALKEFQDKKIGASLMKRCIEIAEQERREWIWLGVNEFNYKALDFYKRFGFEVFGTKRFQLVNVVDEDLLMKRKI